MTENDSKTTEASPEEVASVESPPPSLPSGPEDTAGGESAAEAEAPPVAAEADTVAGELAALEAQADTTAGVPDASAESSAGGVAAESADKKKRRRRRKKKASQAGAAEAPAEAPSEAKVAHHHAPFLHLFSGGVTRKHAFSVGEVIAGRVERVEHGTVVIDVFGKATAIADANEPREIPLVTHDTEEPESEAEPTPQAAADIPAAADAPAPSPMPAAQAPTPSPTPEMSKHAQAWELSATEVTEVLDYDLGEADTVVGAQAYDPMFTAQVELAATMPPSLESAAKDADASDDAAVEAPERPSEPPEPVEDLSDADLTLLDPLPELEPPETGAIFRGRIGAVAESGHIAIVNRLVDKAAVRKALHAAREQHRRVQGVVYGYNRGGFDVLVGGVRAFCPASAMSLTPIEDPNAFLGQRSEFSLPHEKGGKKAIIVSRRNILEKEARKRARERMEELEVGTRLKGKVIDVRDYGVLVDLGDGLDGLVHMSEVSWSRGVKVHDVAKVGDEVDVEVLKIQPSSRKDRFGRVSLSMRACQPDPWDAAADTLRPGMPVKGKVARTTEFGAFVEIKENIEGLLHISELGGSRELTHAKQAVSEGDEIDVVIERVDREQRRISLSKLSEADARAIEAGEIEVGKAPGSLKPGSHISVIVKRVEHGGAQVQVDGILGKRGRGFIPNRELQDVGSDKRRGLSQGDVVEVKIIGTERDGTLRCSIRARLLDEERKAVRDYRKESAKQGLGTFGDLLKAKLGGSSD
jgi:small subunit ribosomal protein S1